MPIQDDRLTFGRIAKEWSRELTDAKAPGRLSRDGIFHEMLKALWRGDFETEEGESCLSIARPPKGGAKRADGKFVDAEHKLAHGRYEPINRRWLLAAMPPIAGLTLPHKSILWPSGEIENGVPWADLKNEIPWDMLIALKPGEYDDLFRRSYLEELSILKDRFGEWCDTRGDRRPAFWFGKDPGLDQSARSKGGARRGYDRGLQEFVDYVRDQLHAQGRKLTLGTLTDWLCENATPDEPCVSGIPNCDEVYAEAGKISWKDSSAHFHEHKLRILERYIRRAKTT